LADTLNLAAPSERLVEFDAMAAAFQQAADAAREESNTSAVGPEALTRVLTAAIKLYAAKIEAEGAAFPPVSAEKITPTEIVVFVSEAMRAADLNLFDLSMWYRRAR
jgi:hypothetical protein